MVHVFPQAGGTDVHGLSVQILFRQVAHHDPLRSVCHNINEVCHNAVACKDYQDQDEGIGVGRASL